MKGRFYKKGGAYWPLRQEDKEAFSGFKQGTIFDGNLTRQSERSLLHHQMYFAGLLELAMTYWEPDGGTVSPSEESILTMFCKRVEKVSEQPGALQEAKREFLIMLRQHRAEKYEAPNKSKDALHHWVVVEAGYFDIIMTPFGQKKVPKSISFNAMPDQKDFADFYKAAFSVVWKFILSRTFKTEDEAQAAVDELLSMG